MNITYNQTYLFPPMAAGQTSTGYQYPINLCGMNNIYTVPHDASVVPSYVNGYATPSSVAHHTQHKASVNMSSDSKLSSTQQFRNMVNVPVSHDQVTFPSCSYQPTINSNDMYNGYVYSNCVESKNTQNQALTQSSSAHQLRLPSISVTSNMAANVMSEECDLGYCSFTDLSPLSEVPEGSNKASHNYIFEAQSAFANIIDEVLDSMDSSAFEGYTPMLPDNIKTEPTVDFSYEQSCQRTADSEKNRNESGVTRSPCSLYQGGYIISSELSSKTYGKIKTEKRAKISVSCELCNKTLQTKASLRSHMKMHKGEKPYDCTYCSKSFAQKSTLRTHIRTHTGEKPYTCKFCYRAFSDYSTYRKHVRVHTGEKPYGCDVCHRRFTQSGNMIRHREMHFKADK